MVPIISLLIVLTLSMIVTRVAAMALMLTGMSRETAKFQARSAFTGVGFTTTEAEDVVGHPVRRQIVMTLMLLGNLGIGAVVATIMVSFIRASESDDWWWQIGSLVVGLTVLALAATNRKLERHMNRGISWVLRRWSGLHVRDYVSILHLQDDFVISELLVEPQDWLANRTLIDLRLPNEGVLVLGVRRSDGSFIGTPTGEMLIRPDDTLILYGRGERVEELDQRRCGRRGDEAHLEACDEHEDDLEEQEQLETQRADETA